MIEDRAEGLSIDWRVDGKVKSVTKKDGTVISFQYDGLGNRISKKMYNPSNPDAKEITYYMRDAQGNPLAVYGLGKKMDQCAMTVNLNNEIVTADIRIETKEEIIVADSGPYVIEAQAEVTHRAEKRVNWLPGPPLARASRSCRQSLAE